MRRQPRSEWLPGHLQKTRFSCLVAMVDIGLVLPHATAVRDRDVTMGVERHVYGSGDRPDEGAEYVAVRPGPSRY